MEGDGTRTEGESRQNGAQRYAGSPTITLGMKPGRTPDQNIHDTSFRTEMR